MLEENVENTHKLLESDLSLFLGLDSQDQKPFKDFK